MPISYADATPLLAALGGPSCTDRTGAVRLPITYHMGPGAAKVHWPSVRLESEADLRRDRPDSRRSESGPVGGARQPPRWLGVRRVGSAVRPRRHDGRGQGHRRAGEARAGGPNARSSTRAGMARRPACSARPSGPRHTPRSCSRKRCCISTPTTTVADSWAPAAAIAAALVNQVAEWSDRSGDRRVGTRRGCARS